MNEIYNYKRENYPSWVLNESEGWNLFLESRNDGYKLERLVHPTDARFKSDVDAIIFVIAKAVADESERHIQALQTCGEAEKRLFVSLAKTDLQIDIGFHPEHGLYQTYEDGYKNFLSTSNVPLNLL